MAGSWDGVQAAMQQDWEDSEFKVRVVVQESVFHEAEDDRVVLVSFIYDPNQKVVLWGIEGEPQTTCPSEASGGTDNLWETIREPVGWVHIDYAQGDGVETFVYIKEDSPAFRSREERRIKREMRHLAELITHKKQDEHEEYHLEEYRRINQVEGVANFSSPWFTKFLTHRSEEWQRSLDRLRAELEAL